MQVRVCESGRMCKTVCVSESVLVYEWWGRGKGSLMWLLPRSRDSAAGPTAQELTLVVSPLLSWSRSLVRAEVPEMPPPL